MMQKESGKQENIATPENTAVPEETIEIESAEETAHDSGSKNVVSMIKPEVFEKILERFGDADTYVRHIENALGITYSYENMLFLDNLYWKEQYVIMLRFGLFDGRPRTVQEISEILDISRERVCRIERKTVHKIHMGIRRPEKRLRDYLE